MINKCLFSILGAFIAVASVAGEITGIILGNGNYMNGGDSHTENERCELRVMKDGNLRVRRFDSIKGDFRVTWNTGFKPASDYYTVLLTSRGTLKISTDRGNKVVYETARFADATGVTLPYILHMDDDCILRINGTDPHDGQLYSRTVWSNVRSTMTNMDVMQRGDIMVGSTAVCPRQKTNCVEAATHIRLLPNCQLKQSVGRDMADAGAGVWRANYNATGVQECYVYVDKDFVGLFRGRFDKWPRGITYPNRTGLLWQTAKGNWDKVQVNGDSGFHAD